MRVVRGTLNSCPAAIKLPISLMDSKVHDAKVYKLSMEQIFFEIQIMANTALHRHPNIVDLLGVAFMPSGSEGLLPLLVLEAAHTDYPDLRHYLNTCRENFIIPLEVVYNLLSDIADGIAVLHVFGVVHGDIKPENILLFEHSRCLVAKITDFGHCGIDISGEKPRALTSEYAAREFSLYNNERVGRVEIDVYSFGLVCGELSSNGKKARFIAGKDEIDYAYWQKRIESCYPSCPKGLYLDSVLELLHETTRMNPAERIRSLSQVRSRLLGPYVAIRLH
jgi:serine/threonine protein kinase